MVFFLSTTSSIDSRIHTSPSGTSLLVFTTTHYTTVEVTGEVIRRLYYYTTSIVEVNSYYYTVYYYTINLSLQLNKVNIVLFTHYTRFTSYVLDIIRVFLVHLLGH